MARHMSSKIARILRRNLLPLRKIGHYIQDMLRSGKDPITQFDDGRDRPGDTWIRASLWQRKGITPVEAILFKVSELVRIIIDNQLRVKAQDLVTICEYSFHLYKSTVFRTILVGIEKRNLLQNALILWECFGTIGEYFNASMDRARK
jgi:hypothetical protein